MDFYWASLIDADEEQLIICYIQGEPLTQPMTQVLSQTVQQDPKRWAHRVQ